MRLPLALSVRTHLAVIALLAAWLAACGGEAEVEATPTPTATATAAPATTTPAATPPGGGAAVEPRLRDLVLQRLVDGGDVDDDVLAEIDVEVLSLPGMGSDLWLAVSSGPGIWQIGDGFTPHILAIYERRGDDTLAEVVVHPLTSEPTIAMPELLLDVPVAERGIWIAVHGFTGAHGGTFELLWFDGTTVATEITSFSSSPGAAYIEDLDGDGVPEIVLDVTDHYVYCYACGVWAWSEILYRWVDGRPVVVPIEAVPSDSQLVHDLTEQAALYAHAGLWRRALETAERAAEESLGDEDVMWFLRAIELDALPRLEAAGSEPQPLVTNVLAGEYDAAAALISALAPEVAFSLISPLISGTVAEGWEPLTSDYLIEYSSMALAVDSSLAPAYLVRALGHALAERPDWNAALIDVESALALEPGYAFYQAAVTYLLTRASGASA